VLNTLKRFHFGAKESLLMGDFLGFAVVGDYDDPNIKMAQATAFEQMLKWINEH